MQIAAQPNQTNSNVVFIMDLIKQYLRHRPTKSNFLKNVRFVLWELAVISGNAGKIYQRLLRRPEITTLLPSMNSDEVS